MIDFDAKRDELAGEVAAKLIDIREAANYRARRGEHAAYTQFLKLLLNPKRDVNDTVDALLVLEQNARTAAGAYADIISRLEGQKQGE